MKKLQKMRKDRKGFTLVELIVVLVILAILAAMLVPALLGYIDRAKEGKYEEEVHSIYTALQVVYDEAYAKGTIPSFTFADTNEAGDAKSLNDMVSPAKVTGITSIKSKSGKDMTGTTLDSKTHEDYTVDNFEVEFTSQDGTTKVGGTLSNGEVVIDLSSAVKPANTQQGQQGGGNG